VLYLLLFIKFETYIIQAYLLESATMNQLLYVLHRLLQLLVAITKATYRDLRLKCAELKYGGMGQIPASELGQYMTPASDAFIEKMHRHTRIKTVIDQLCTHFNINPYSTRLMETYDAYISGRCWRYLDDQRMSALDNSPVIYTAVWELLCFYGDITPGRVERMHPTEAMRLEWQSLLTTLDQQESPYVRSE
jgi:hypothetical protein